jgi:hypothetical protein
MNAGNTAFFLKELKLYGISQYLQNVPTTNTYSLTKYDAIPYLTSNTTTISNYTPIILNGTYISSMSSVYGVGYEAYRAFDSDVSTFAHTIPYYLTSGLYTGPNKTPVINIGYIAGEWIQIQLPYSLYVTRYSIMPRIGYAGQFQKAWYLVGSNNGITWYTIDNRTDIVVSNTSIYYEYGNNYGNKNYYSYFRMIITEVGGVNVPATMSSIRLEGIGTTLQPTSSVYGLIYDNAVPTMTSASTTISGNMPEILNGTYICTSSGNGYSNNYYELRRVTMIPWKPKELL